MKRKTFEVTLTLSAPDWLRPEAAKLELRSRINELCQYANGYGQLEDYHELEEGHLRAENIVVRKAS